MNENDTRGLVDRGLKEKLMGRTILPNDRGWVSDLVPELVNALVPFLNTTWLDENGVFKRPSFDEEFFGAMDAAARLLFHKRMNLLYEKEILKSVWDLSEIMANNKRNPEKTLNKSFEPWWFDWRRQEEQRKQKGPLP